MIRPTLSLQERQGIPPCPVRHRPSEIRRSARNEKDCSAAGLRFKIQDSKFQNQQPSCSGSRSLGAAKDFAGDRAVTFGIPLTVTAI
jgi:hypothetical protein